jgi:ribosomal protein S27AE
MGSNTVPRGSAIRPACPKCGATHNATTDSRPVEFEGITTTRRRRRCTNCGEAWTTFEFSDGQLSQIRKDVALRLIRRLGDILGDALED